MSSTKLQTIKGPGRFISFEGIEGAGKTTQIEKLKDYLEQLGYEVMVYREPGGTVFGEHLRTAILESKSELAPMAQAYLFASSRAQLIQEKILPALQDKNTVIIADRFIDSSISYQGFGARLGAKTIIDIHQYEPLCYMPHRTYYLSISVEKSLERMQIRGEEQDYFESKSIDYYEQIKLGLDYCAKEFPKRVKLISGNASTETVFNEIINDLKKVL